jgi:hypothetical protein
MLSGPCVLCLSCTHVSEVRHAAWRGGALSSGDKKLWWRSFGHKNQILATTAFPLTARGESQAWTVKERHLSQNVIPSAAKDLHFAVNCGSLSLCSAQGRDDKIWPN